MSPSSGNLIVSLNIDPAPMIQSLRAAADAMEAAFPTVEREATPPAPAVDDEPGVRVNRNDAALGAEALRGHSLATPEDAEAAAVRLTSALGIPTPPPAPEPREDAVEALARVWNDECAVFRVDGRAKTIRDRMRLLLAALDRGAVPGYGPTGDRAGEVRVDAEHLSAALDTINHLSTPEAHPCPLSVKGYNHLRAALDGTP